MSGAPGSECVREQAGWIPLIHLVEALPTPFSHLTPTPGSLPGSNWGSDMAGGVGEEETDSGAPRLMRPSARTGGHFGGAEEGRRG